MEMLVALLLHHSECCTANGMIAPAPDAPPPPHPSADQINPLKRLYSYADALRWAIAIAKGLRYLHRGAGGARECWLASVEVEGRLI